ncbi:MAG: bifunctional [glutamine synthetase] adenylyltransferase/[glutamine synthetase]-adenylyl-L-tyrosine phosphorylase [Alphaproteobacteria bacterium]|nr:bifunctional [glutamine synthetase] adenylyltransferase/[glutamine synthetase]-adenylyl-L-tyrosine phosphorylase [Alphaproteobacteria bacterium]
MEAGPLSARITQTQTPFDRARAARAWRELKAHPALRALRGNRPIRDFISGVAGNSAFLSRLMLRVPATLAAILNAAPEDWLAERLASLRAEMEGAESFDEAMRHLRNARRDVALCVALADLAGAWDWQKVTRALTEAADISVQAALRYLLREASAQGRIETPVPGDPEENCGLFVLAMGKHGAGELNYSSDIDLVVFFDRDIARVSPKLEPQPVFIRIVQSLVRMLQEHTADGYAYRVDLRLRPDAGATQVALSTEAAEQYYESTGQNWERAAYIKARVVAGDREVGAAFLRALTPFVFRKYLDYAAIEDIHSIKRQIHDHQGHGEIAVAGHNVKLGRGGIREIEFFVQTQQLILGGRDPGLRERRTVDGLVALAQRGTINKTTARELTEAYGYLRTLEHRLQMIDDQQTHTIPETDAEVKHLALFMGHGSARPFEREVRGVLETVTRHYAALFESAPPLSEKKGSLVFTGVEDDPDTLRTLSRLGFTRPKDVAATIRGWHHGRIRATRSQRAREQLTALTPALLEALAATANPDLAFAGFDRFLSGLPAGIQVFALLYANPTLLGLLADAFGTAPRLASVLGKDPGLLDALLDAEFLTRVPDRGELEGGLTRALAAAPDTEDMLDRARRWQKEQLLRVGLQVVRGRITAGFAGEVLSDVAETAIAGLVGPIEREFVQTHGRIPGGAAVILGLGKLGGREMTVSSDVDLIVVYDANPDISSNGAKPLAASQYFARLTQRLISGLTAPTSEGRLYDVDMRLRPSGSKGPVATSLEAFRDYHTHEAWTWERMALTRARPIAGSEALGRSVAAIIEKTLTTPRDPAQLRADVRDMREKITQEFPSKDPWNVKYVRGGHVDLEFIVQTLLLLHAPREPALLTTNMADALARLKAARILLPDVHATLEEALLLFQNLTQIMRIALEDNTTTPIAEAGPGLHALLARAADAPSFAHLDRHLRLIEDRVASAFAAVMR